MFIRSLICFFLPENKRKKSQNKHLELSWSPLPLLLTATCRVKIVKTAFPGELCLHSLDVKGIWWARRTWQRGGWLFWEALLLCWRVNLLHAVNIFQHKKWYGKHCYFHWRVPSIKKTENSCINTGETLISNMLKYKMKERLQPRYQRIKASVAYL